MKRALEALVVVAALALAATVAYQVRARRAARADLGAAAAPETHPGSDVGSPAAAASAAGPADRNVASLPPMKMVAPPRRVRRADPPPPPPGR